MIRFSFIGRGRQRGVALIITLGAILMLSGLVVAFFSLSTFNRLISSSGTNQMKAESLARSSLDIVVGNLREELRVNSKNGAAYTQSGISIYLPGTAVNLLPTRSGIGTDATTPNLLKVSASGVPMWTGGSLSGSSIPISQKSENRRSISSARWFTSTTESPNLGSQGTLPTWIYVTQGNGPKTPALNAAKDPTSDDYAVGRFAYTVYDLSGLLDANVAGYAASIPSTEVGLKSSAAYADTSVLGIGVNALAAWRNPATGADPATFLEWAAGIPRTVGTINAAAIAAARSGHLAAVSGDRAILSRHDLLGMLANQKLSTAAPYLSHFSRSLDAPSWVPESDAQNNYTYSSSAESATLNGAPNPNRDLPNLRFSVSGTTSVTHYRDDGTTERYNVLAGDMSVQRRFSLGKLAWLTYAGIKSGIPTAAVRSCFGLQWDETNERWNYVELSSTNGIKTLAQVASEGREPNFFETLKAGVLLGSVGLASANSTDADAGQQTLDKNGDLQILRLGANIIDCSDADNYPTTITLNVSGTDTPVHGVEDLPYLYDVKLSNFHQYTKSGATFTVQNLALVLMPELFNPHAPSSPSTGPTGIRIRLTNGNFSSVFVSGSGYGTQPLYRPSIPALALTSITPAYSANAFRNGVAPITAGDSASAFSTLVPWATDTRHGFLVYNYTGLPESCTYGSLPIDAQNSGDLMVVVECLSPSGQWRVYDTLCGNEAWPSTSGLNGISKHILEFNPIVFTSSATLSAIGTCGVMSKFDPRTTRFGVSYGNVYSASVPAPVPPVAPASYWGINNHLPFGVGSIGSTTAGLNGLFPGLWPQGAKAGWSDVNTVANVADPDATVRPADGWIGSAAGSTAAGTANLFQNVTNTGHAARPIILQRPFRSVAELGYVFRDSPWKTINFFDDTSGDRALLDLFSVCDEPVLSAGRINLNTSQPLVMNALLSKSGTSSDGSGPLSTAAASALATGYGTYSFNNGVPTASLPQTLAGIPTFMAATGAATILTSYLDAYKSHREAVARTLASAAQTRTWNVLIDVVAQTGRFPTSAAGLDQFVVEGEKRYWLSVAIDRITGKIIDQQLEPAED